MNYVKFNLLKQVMVTFAATYVIVALSIDRLYAIAWPLKFKRSGKYTNNLKINK